MSSKKTNTPSVKSKNERNRAVPFSARLFAKTDKPRNRPRADRSLPFASMYSVSVDLPPVGIGIARGDRFCQRNWSHFELGWVGSSVVLIVAPLKSRLALRHVASFDGSKINRGCH